MTQPRADRPITRRAALTVLMGGGAAAAAGCANGHFSLLGYTTAPNYDPGIKTVYVPVFRSRFLETTPFRGAEFTLTRAVVDAIESKTPMKVVSDPAGADSELQGTLVTINKVLLNRTPQNEAREVSLYLYVELVWLDLRPGREGKVLSNQRRGTMPAAPLDPAFDPTLRPPPPTRDVPQPVVLSTQGRALPELGESITTALQMAINRMADAVVSAMEQPW